MGAHLIAANLLKTPELALSEPEAKELAKSIKNLMAHYDLNVSPRAMATYQLIATAVALYTPRILMATARRTKEARTRKAMQSGAIVPGGVSNPPPMPNGFDESAPQQGTMKYN